MPDTKKIIAAGIAFMCNGRLLLLKRSDQGDHAGEWALPGGKVETGETVEQAARREVKEEIGIDSVGKLEEALKTTDVRVEYTTFLADADAEFPVTLNNEHTAAIWAGVDDLPSPLHPGVLPFISEYLLTNGEDELTAARKIAIGLLPSPQVVCGVSLFAIRITGTGVSYRRKDGEYVYRSPIDYLNKDFVARCAGLPVMIEHVAGMVTTGDDLQKQVVGTTFYPYIKGDEIWAVAKVNDQTAVKILTEMAVSTSPQIILRRADEERISIDGTPVLFEGEPIYVDHIAIVQSGVWDKGGNPSGVANETGLTNQSEGTMPDKEPKEETKEVSMAELASKIDALPDAIAKAIAGAMATKQPDTQEPPAKPMEAAAKPDPTPAPADVAVKKESEGYPETVVKKESDGNSDAIAALQAKIDAQAAEIVAMREKQAADSATLNTLSTEPAEADRKSLADAWAEADAVMRAVGDSAVQAMRGESLIDYRMRLLERATRHPSFSGVKLDHSIDSLAKVAKADSGIASDYIKAMWAKLKGEAEKPANLPAGHVRTRVSTKGGATVMERVAATSSPFTDQFSIRPLIGAQPI